MLRRAVAAYLSKVGKKQLSEVQKEAAGALIEDGVCQLPEVLNSKLLEKLQKSTNADWLQLSDRMSTLGFDEFSTLQFKEVTRRGYRRFDMQGEELAKLVNDTTLMRHPAWCISCQMPSSDRTL